MTKQLDQMNIPELEEELTRLSRTPRKPLDKKTAFEEWSYKQRVRTRLSYLRFEALSPEDQSRRLKAEDQHEHYGEDTNTDD